MKVIGVCKKTPHAVFDYAGEVDGKRVVVYADNVDGGRLLIKEYAENEIPEAVIKPTHDSVLSKIPDPPSLPRKSTDTLNLFND